MGGDPRYKVNPPLRSSDDVMAVREALLDGTIDVIGTDHAPHTHDRKRGPWRTAAFGLTALETALPVVAHVLAETGTVDWRFVSRIMSEAPARIGRIAETAGRPLKPGEPATFALVESNAAWTVTDSARFTKSGNNPFLGSVFSHRIVATAIDGRLVHGTLPLLRKATHTA
jgi:dihydroorotase